ncbi:hypothetical protein AMYX_05340 [Anaeromyxobacter diazotrophicus]|uniref:Uncharacterized protein n=1 Tax=Anaeromyxobacter diazotrophicus TaxID=2590199 RepID=A0A7I9VHC5_9BACT|nr:hypothetical protein AMYX_05340 [Anaeromyxobacter diazotrophicus]
MLDPGHLPRQEFLAELHDIGRLDHEATHFNKGAKPARRDHGRGAGWRVTLG